MRRRLRHSCESGFSPAEFLVSIAVIGVVAAVGLVGLGQVTVASRDQANRADRQVLENAEEAWAAHQSLPVGYATVSVLVRDGYLKKASVRNIVCLTPAPPGALEAVGDFFVLGVDEIPADRAAGDAACTAAATKRQLPGPPVASAGTSRLP